MYRHSHLHRCPEAPLSLRLWRRRRAGFDRADAALDAGGPVGPAAARAQMRLRRDRKWGSAEVACRLHLWARTDGRHVRPRAGACQTQTVVRPI